MSYHKDIQDFTFDLTTGTIADLEQAVSNWEGDAETKLAQLLWAVFANDGKAVATKIVHDYAVKMAEKKAGAWDEVA